MASDLVHRFLSEVPRSSASGPPPPGSPRLHRFCPLHSPGDDRCCRALRFQVPTQLPFSLLSSAALLLPPFAPRALPRFLATTASAAFFPALTGKISPGKVQNLSPRAVRLYRMRLGMTFGLCCSQPACRPHPASLPVRVPTVEGLLRASFGFTSRLRLAFRYGCRHQLRRAPFISIDSAHAGHTGADPLVCAGPPGPALHSKASACHPRQAGQGAGCGPGGPPHNLCRCSVP
jgi:hypothetical protein